MASDAQRRAVARYDKTNTRKYTLKINLNTDADIAEALANAGNVQGYLKALIRQDISSNRLVTDTPEDTEK